MLEVGLNNYRMRQLNKELIMSLVWRHKVLTKSHISRLTNLTIPAVTNILDELLEEKLICHSQQNLSSRGVGSGSYSLPNTLPMTLCLNVAPTKIESQLVDFQLNPVGELQIKTIEAKTPAELLNSIMKLFNGYKAKHARNEIQLAIALHGQVDPEAGVSQNMPQAPWKEHVEVKYLLEEKLNCNVMIDNDCIMLALAEKWLGTNEKKDFCVINVDYGIGSSFIINGSVYRGSLYGSGQIGHTIVNPDGMACSCGRYGCLETVASLNAIKKKVRTWLKTHADVTPDVIEGFNTEQLITLWREREPTVYKLVEDGANAIGLSLYNFLNILNINQIWFYGRSCQFGQQWLDTIIHNVVINPFDPANSIKKNATQIEFGQLTRQQQLMGIAYLYVEESLSEFRF
ncbi:ROK family protein [Vibrio porteresiae]|uniref:ROK family protein n=1 Tax=Vibrio porteresiae DSM 19223 TaxID=1123496 RepID=A0ABZ0QI76_9VIBR|nr:ROK family protein [Vibrio porteresiae]WPC76197.1 ROK family protein [Vibrio porteresiae DSM 19223]